MADGTKTGENARSRSRTARAHPKIEVIWRHTRAGFCEPEIRPHTLKFWQINTFFKPLISLKNDVEVLKQYLEAFWAIFELVTLSARIPGFMGLLEISREWKYSSAESNSYNFPVSIIPTASLFLFTIIGI